MASPHVAVCLEPAPAVTAARYATAKVTKVIHKLFVIVTSQARQGVKLTRAQIIARSTDYTLGGGDQRGRHEQINVWHVRRLVQPATVQPPAKHGQPSETNEQQICAITPEFSGLR